MDQKIKQDITIGDNIRSLRIEAGLKQAQVVAQMEILGCTISRETYAKMESGIYNIRMSELRAMKQIFQATWDDILG